MKILKQLIKLHKILFVTTILSTFLSIILNLCWNKFLAQMLDILGDTDSLHLENGTGMFFAAGIWIILMQTISEYL